MTTTFYRGGGNVKPTPADLRVDAATGLLRPTYGISVFDRPDNLDRFGGAYRVDSIPGNLKIIQRGKDPHHYEIAPASPMTLDEYEDALTRIVLAAV